MTIDLMARAGASDHSPCVGHCTYDAADYCLSCRRSTDEITAWRDAEDSLRASSWARIPAEIDAAGLDVMRLPISPEDIAEIAEEMLDLGGARAVGVTGHWAYAHDLTRNQDGVLTAASEDGDTTITLDLSGKMRALAWARGDRTLADGFQDMPILIVVPRARIKDAPNAEPTMREDGMLDLGYGLASIAICEDGQTSDDKELVMQNLLATSRCRAPADERPAKDARAIPDDLTLPESYVLAAILMPKGEAPLS